MIESNINKIGLGTGAMPWRPTLSLSLSQPLGSKFGESGTAEGGLTPRRGGMMLGGSEGWDAGLRSGHTGNLQMGCPDGAMTSLRDRGIISGEMWGPRGSRLAGPCRGRLEAGKAVRSIMGDPGEPRSFQEYISPSGKKICDFDGFGGMAALCGLLGFAGFIIPTVF